MNYLFPAEIMRLKMRGEKPDCRTCTSFHAEAKTWCHRYKNAPISVDEANHCKKYRELQKPS